MRRLLARLCDGWMCGMMHAVHRRRGHETTTLAELENYLNRWEGRNRRDFFRTAPAEFSMRGAGFWEWQSPWRCPEPENARARAWHWEAGRRPGAPTVLVFHALMSASDLGYRRMAVWFHRRGWNVVFPHLPYHYSRTPRGCWNGELAMTSHLLRNGNALRQAVVEARQILEHLRAKGCRTFGLLGTSYGGWVAGLLASVEPDIRFTALIQPVVDPESAIWETPAGRVLRAQVEANGITRAHVARHHPFVAPIAARPASGSSLLTLGLYDRIAPPGLVRKLASAWDADVTVEVEQGHFGYSALRATLRELDALGFLER